MTMALASLPLGWPGGRVARRFLVFHGGGNNLAGEVKEVTQIPGALVGEVPVVMSPCELFSHKPLGMKALHGLDHVKVGHLLELGMLGSVEILLSNHNSLLEKELINSHAVSLGHQHSNFSCRSESSNISLVGLD